MKNKGIIKGKKKKEAGRDGEGKRKEGKSKGGRKELEKGREVSL